MKSSIKKIISAILIVAMLSLTLVPAMAEGGQGDFIVNPDYPISYEDVSAALNQIMALEEFISVDNGRFVFDMQRARDRGIDQELLNGQQAWLDSINQMAEAGEVVINNDLSIISNEGESACGHWYSCGGGRSTSISYHWWGYSRYACDCETNRMINDFNSVAAIAAGLTMLTKYFGVSAVPFGLSSAYFWLLSSRLGANNHGRGVYIGMTWILAFNIDPQ